MLARFFNELRRDSLHLRADDFFALQILEASCLQSLHVLCRDSLHLHPDQLLDIWRKPRGPQFANIVRRYTLDFHSHDFVGTGLQAQIMELAHIFRTSALHFHPDQLMDAEIWPNPPHFANVFRGLSPARASPRIRRPSAPIPGRESL